MKQKFNSTDLKNLLQKMMDIANDSPTYEKLAHYIEKNYLRMIFMTAGEVAHEANISQGSVSRFCRALGYYGFNDFLRSLQKFVSEEIAAPQRLQYLSQNKSNNKIRSILNREHKNIDELEAILSQPAYTQLVGKLATAPEIVLLSARMSATLLPYAAYILNKIRNNVVQLQPGNPLWDTVHLRQPDTTLIFTLAFPRYPTMLVSKMQELKQEGFTIAAITDSMVSPVSYLADLVLLVPITISSIFDIYSTPMLLLNFLLRDVAQKIEGLEQRLDRLETMEAKNRSYYKQLME
ncbi:MurR/RpiR family transcriptional regulator [Sporomusa acidovorans]|uniref:HTH rpiR-type domain-containing protein n=1 Tax=Sporomusa acidovorans (strain ATCC 49682 / DSM 3132 / Mol) TaxID=1123286 RepID=A0ABZ3IX45_SPOA4|nr:MurR/RpiR family transcriptional regulator [Sporomusa acidovorans]OZC13036.1 DNA-binding transcriptional repressor RpiR [Sporomusa acidovorans DSM 3132]SDF51491.1 transcriptional regulator, RpiR family [Sporomusa acidovorans]